jgi:imidazolonepropionase-like amidohydrolase
MNPRLRQEEAHLQLLDTVKGVGPVLRKKAALADVLRSCMNWRLIVLLLAVSFCVASSGKEAPPTARVYIIHVTVINTETGRESSDQTVIIAGDRISSIQPSASMHLPRGAKLIDASGKFLIPGLWDMHVHGASNGDARWSYPLFIANGVAGVRDMWGPEDANKFRAHPESETMPAPHVYLASPIIDGKPPAWQGSIVVTSPEEARTVVDKYKRNGADFIKVYQRLARDEYFAIADEAKRQHIPFAGHLPRYITAWEAAAAGQRSIEHLTALPLSVSSQEQELRTRWNSLPGPYSKTGFPVLLQAYRSYSDQQAQRLFSEFKKNQTWQVPTLTVLRAQSRINDPQFTHDPRLRYMPPDWQNVDYMKQLPYSNYTAAEFDLVRELFEYNKKLVGAMFRAGVPLLAGTDAGNPFCFPGFSLHDEMGLMVESGVTPLGALQMATRNAAVFMNATDRYGSVAPGKVADLVLLDADPLKDIHNTTKISAVFLAGKEFDRTALDELLNWRDHCTWSESDNNWHCRW